MRSALLFLGLIATASLAGCSGTPRDASQQWVSRDAWDATCAEKAMVETWKATNGRWKVKGEVYVIDVEASFRLTDDCTSGLPLVGKAYKALEVVPFRETVEMSKCKRDGETGWAIPGQERARCWTGPTLLEQR